MLCSACTTTPDPEVLVQIRPVKENVPAPLKRRCEEPYPRAAMKTVGDSFARGDDNEAKLLRCSAKVDKIIAWDAEP